MPGMLGDEAFVGAYVMKEESAAVAGSTDKLSKYVGKGKLGYVYLSMDEKAQERWKHAAEDIARALEVGR